MTKDRFNKGLSTERLLHGGDLSKYGKDFQIKLLALLSKDRIFAFSILPILKDEYFSDIWLRKIFLCIRDYTQEYSSIPTMDNIKIKLQEKEEKITSFEPMLESIETISLEDRDFVIDNSRRFCFTKHRLIELEKEKILLEQGDFEKAQRTSIESYKHAGTSNRQIYDLKTDYEKIFEDDIHHRPVPTPFPTINKCTKGGPGSGNLVIAVAPSNFGKCFAPGTELIMYNGSIKKVEDIQVGDVLMGPDSKPRNVTSLASGIEEMYEVHQKKSGSYTVNKSHILCLQNCCFWDKEFGKQITITVDEYLKQSDTWKKKYRGYKPNKIEFNNYSSKDLPIDPYFLGLWLGDGATGKPIITNVDPEIVEYLFEYGQEIGNDVRWVDKHNENSAPNWCFTSCRNKEERKNKIQPLANKLRTLNLFGHKHIPDCYLYNTRENRLKLLAGLIDSDGYLEKETYTCFDVGFKLKELSNQTAFLARSLGFKVFERTTNAKCYKPDKTIKNCGEFYVNRIIGLTYEIPTKIERKQAKIRNKKSDLLWTNEIEIESKGVGLYFGFTLSDTDPDRKFLLKDFTVVHNTAVLTACAREANRLGKNVAFFSFEIGGEDILRRYIAGQLGVKQEELKFHKKEVKSAVIDDTLGNFRLIQERATLATIEQIHADLEYLKSTGFFPDMVCVDSLNQLKLLGENSWRMKDDNQKFELLSEQLRDLANDLKIPFMTVMQTNRTGFGEAAGNIMSIGKAIEPFQVADILWMFNQTPDLEAEGICILTMLKNRLGPKNIALECKYDPNMGTFKEIKEVNALLLKSDKEKAVVKTTIVNVREKLKAGGFDPTKR